MTKEFRLERQVDGLTVELNIIFSKSTTKGGIIVGTAHSALGGSGF